MGRHKEKEILQRVREKIKEKLNLVADGWQVTLPLIKDTPSDIDENTKKIMNKVINLRIDYLGVDNKSHYHIFEIKQNLDFSALGQLFAYKKLFCVERNVSENRVHLHVIYTKAYETVKFIYREYNIRLWEV